jgi:glycerol uptake facilitator-like aquaporin
VAEFAATTLFCFIGCGVAVSSQAFAVRQQEEGRGALLHTTLDTAFIVGVAMAFGFAISVLAYTIAPISGGHMNPAVTLAFVLLGEMNLFQFTQYVVAQVFGAVFGVSLV